MSSNLILQQCRASLDTDPFGKLELQYRVMIWKSFGVVRHRKDKVIHGAGWRKRTHLARLCVEHVRPIWKHTFPSLDIVDRILESTVVLGHSEAEGRALESLLQRGWTQADNIMSEFQQQTAFGVLHAAVRMGWIYLFDEPILALPKYRDCPLQVDKELDVNSLDAAWHASMVYSGMEYDPSVPAVIRRRREYWSWYIDQAVPIAQHIQ